MVDINTFPQQVYISDHNLDNMEGHYIAFLDEDGEDETLRLYPRRFERLYAPETISPCTCTSNEDTSSLQHVSFLRLEHKYCTTSCIVAIDSVDGQTVHIEAIEHLLNYGYRDVTIRIMPVNREVVLDMEFPEVINKLKLICYHFYSQVPTFQMFGTVQPRRQQNTIANVLPISIAEEIPPLPR